MPSSRPSSLVHASEVKGQITSAFPCAFPCPCPLPFYEDPSWAHSPETNAVAGTWVFFAGDRVPGAAQTLRMGKGRDRGKGRGMKNRSLTPNL